MQNKMGVLIKLNSEPALLSNGSGYQIKVDEFKIPSVTYLTKKTYGSLSVTVWPEPSDGQAKVCVQGTMYLAFISFVLPLVLKDMETTKAALGVSNNSEVNTDVESFNNEEGTETEKLYNTIRRLEKEVINISDYVSSKVDLALTNALPGAIPSNLLDRIENLESVL